MSIFCVRMNKKIILDEPEKSSNLCKEMYLFLWDISVLELCQRVLFQLIKHNCTID